jgi:hypothetical protein
MFYLYVALILAAEIAALALLRFVLPGAPVLPLTAILPLTLVAALLVRRRTRDLAYQVRNISPEEVTGPPPDARDVSTPEKISASIVERAAEIRRTLTESPSEVRVEMCALGYRTCVNDMITLTHLTNEELPNANLLRRLRLRRARKKAIDALSEAREALPPDALRATHQEL